MEKTTEEFTERMFASALGTIEILSMHIGDRLGWYRALADHGPATPAELAARTGCAERYAREWLEQQACSTVLTVRDDGRFALPPAAAEVLTDTTSLSYLAPVARMLAGAAVQLPALLEAYRTGGGVGWSRFGADVREAEADMNRPWFERELASALASVPDLDAVLARPGARIADIGCGAGWSTVALARAYPDALLEGLDVDAPSVEAATANAATAGLTDRVSFALRDAASLEAGRYDAVFAFECLHDMSRPVSTLEAARHALRPGGQVVIMDEAVGETFTVPGDQTDQLMYGFSLFICLPDGMAEQPTAATGTVMRPDTLRRYALEAGFASIEILPIEGFGLWRFYRLLP
ncbi:class I SAM-dependent methyltransferase [Streptosporangium sp. NPDC050855]|uniref:class I SAM-dependent methyltransferase n=1 Tax=Streptosporangium sp. NPDC050855 TaxID=3366194 RepID=UPI00378E5DE6